MGNPLARIGSIKGEFSSDKLGARIKRAIEKVKR
jgi:hypothetical protein